MLNQFEYNGNVSNKFLYGARARVECKIIRISYRILQIVRGGKVSRMDKVLLIRWKTFADCSLQ